MKKLLAVVLLAVAMVAPAFAAEKGSMEINGKLGILFSPTMKVEARGESADIDFSTTLSLEGDFFYYVQKEFAIGAGLEYVFPSEIDKFDGESISGLKAGTTNLFVQAKYDIALQNDIFNNIYPIAQLGYGIVNTSGEMSGFIDVGNGLYWAIGLGTTIKESFIVELLYAFNYGTIDVPSETVPTIDATLKLFKLKVGYKFAI